MKPKPEIKTIADFLRRIGGMRALTAAMAADDCRGYCLRCGDEAYGVEPDARQYRCESCGQRGVYGAEEIVIHLASKMGAQR